jgi:hypothetical protein
MIHAQWHSRLRRSLSLVERDPTRALKSLDALVAALLAAAENTVNQWHVEQTLEAISIVHSHLNDHRQSAQTMLRVAGLHEQQLTYSKRAFVAACAIAAIELASAGDRRGAVRVLKRAKRMADDLRPPEKLFAGAQKFVDAIPRRRRATSSGAAR